MSEFDLIVKGKENYIAELDRDRKRYERLVKEKGMSDDLALSLAATKMQLENANDELEKAKQKADEFTKWKQSKEYKDLEKEYASMVKQANEKRDQMVDLIRSLANDIKALHDQGCECERLAKKLEKAGFMHGNTFSYLWNLLNKLDKFSHDYRMWFGQ